MNFLQKLFSKNKEDPAAKGQAGKGGISEELPELAVGMSLDVVTADGKLLLTGQVANVDGTSLSLERMPGWLAFDTCEVGDRVMLRGFNRQMIAFNLSGIVQESSRIVFRIKNLKAEHVINQRLSFRLPVNTPAAMFRQDDDHFTQPEECVLVDISTGGACVETDYIHSDEDVVRLRFKLEDYPTMAFLGQIVRGTEYSAGRYRYGVLFAQLKQEEQTALTRTLYNIQTGNRREWSRGMDGSWT
ncbi:PilZ domain-containing protein [Acutalibacter caecimuris]|uniref:PilZ domain-containing protein n=1 Tax=Acutalibacter caecimuris TaxID=3093657 RepID=UPI002AC94681|nr:PilZ domain-containing protein [Acutalibacter sp. M00118]